MRKFIAVYIDLENVAGILDLDKMLQDIILEEDREAPEEYIFAVKIACGNTNSITKLRGQLTNHNFEIREAPRVTGKKNRADLIISLDAFEKLFLDKPSIDRFVFVTSDSDFSVIMDILRKYGKEVWLITKEGDAQRPIFTNCTDNIISLSRPRKPLPKKDKKSEKTKEEPLKGDEKTPPKEEKEERVKDDIADELFKKVLISLDTNVEHKINAIANKMRQLDKSFKIKNTNYKKMTTLAKEFEKKGWFKTHKNKDGHLIITDIETPGC
ncbi:MAG: NYN domain-containing protein [Desulfobacterales bacterium]|nr:NYN domain-containing protein [Desulfobacterales bacterium]MDD4071908.1 NYN domain-containing protein [Desulfobacterales bacterium]MDD4393910.1 NYN domain-containing protein [Desulfobacterales bacterium]